MWLAVMARCRLKYNGPAIRLLEGTLPYVAGVLVPYAVSCMVELHVTDANKC